MREEAQIPVLAVGTLSRDVDLGNVAVTDHSLGPGGVAPEGNDDRVILTSENYEGQNA
jgi:hypothetical protein